MMEIEGFKAGFVAVAGRPNVGKSTLINALLGQKIAAVSFRPQTTRRQQIGILTLDNAQVVFTDTPGIHQPKHKLGKYMNVAARSALEDSDTIVFLVDGSDDIHDEDRMIAETLTELKVNIPVFLILNKIDRIEEEEYREQKKKFQELISNARIILISAKTGNGLPELIEAVIDQLPEHPPYFPSDQVTDTYERDIAADLIRESALNILRDEIPHSIAVRIDEFKERGDIGAYIEATIFVERDSQKGIVIGEGGRMIKRISTAARIEIEKMSERKVFLRIRVKVRKNWRNDDKVLRLFGFQEKGRKR
ncbi:MAG: GTPase Era [Anaerolineales bacterium]